MKSVKVHGEARDWLRSYELEEDRRLRRGDFPCSIVSSDNLKKVKRKRKARGKK